MRFDSSRIEIRERETAVEIGRVVAILMNAFMQYERDIHKRINGRRVVALCSCNITKIEPTNAFEMVRAHQFSIRRNNGFWEVLGSDG